MKTNKSFTKRLKVTKNGKIIGRKAGQNHFNAKESSNEGMSKKRSIQVHFSNKAKARFLPGKFK
jgi:ribosomal protein L35